MKKVKKIWKVRKEATPIVVPNVWPYLAPFLNAILLVDKISDEKTKKIIKKGINLLTLNKKK